MTGMHALHKILANCARPRRERVEPGELHEVEPIFALGIPAVIAESLGPLFFSHCAGGGLWPIVCPGILGLVKAGDTLEIDTVSFVVRNVSTGKTLQAQSLPEIYRAMIEAGGEKPYLKARLAKERQGTNACG